MIVILTKIYDCVLACTVGSMQIMIFYIRQHLFGNAIPRYKSVRDQYLYRGGQPSKEGVRELINKGVSIIVNLRSGNRDMKTIEKYFNGKIKSIHVPIFPFRPNDKSVIKFLRIFTSIEKKDAVFVHCFHGSDRTGLMCAMYRIIFDGWNKQEAIEEMRKNGFHFWHRSIVKYIHQTDIDSLRRKVFIAAS